MKRRGVSEVFERTARKFPSTATSSSERESIAFGTDLNRDPVYLSGEVASSTAFARAMLVLGKVVQTRKPPQKDHSAYQTWVANEYMRIFEEREPNRSREFLKTEKRIMELQSKRDQLLQLLEPLKKLVELKKQNYFDWLYENDRQAWIVLDPIVSVQKDGTFFEAFSGDESIYARVFLPHSVLISAEEPSLGTTNIDFSLLLEREFARVRTYRKMSLTVGLKEVNFETDAAKVDEEKIPLPETWVRGLVEVQSVLGLAPINFEMSSDALAEIIARLESEKEKHGPRSLKFDLKPNSPIRVEIEPWGYAFNDDWMIYKGKTTESIRIWGRRRLSVLKDLLVDTDTVKVLFLGSGMPSFWSVEKDGVELTVGLSGWTSNDWASKAKFSSFVPTTNVSPEQLDQALAFISSQGTTTTKAIAEKFGLATGEAAGLLQKLCLQGKLMFDPKRNIFRWRDLFPTFDLYKEDDSSRELRAGLEIFKSGDIKKSNDEIKDGVRYLSGSVTITEKVLLPLLEMDLDNRPKYAQCNCPFYNHNKLRQGPCRHMIALTLAGDGE